MSKRYTLLLSFIAVFFVAFFAMLCFYSKLATDDYYFIWDVRNHGVIEGVRSQYMEWCGRFAATGLMDIIYKALDVDQAFYFLFPLGSFILLIAGMYLLFSTLTFQFQLKLKRSHQLIFSVLFTALLFFLSVDIGETWIWYCSLSSYLWSIITFVWGCAFLLGNYRKLVSLIISSVCFVYVGGSSEVYSVIYGVMIFIFLLFRYKKAGRFKYFLADPLNKKIIIVYIILGISFLIFFIAPGNYLRDQLFPKHEFLNTLFITAKSIVKFGVLYLPFRLAYILAFAVPFMVLGSYISSEKSAYTLSFRSFFIKATLLFLSLMLLFFLIVAYVMVETGPPRLWFMISFLFAIYAAAVCFYSGYTNSIDKKRIKILSSAGIILALIMLGYNGINQFFIAKKYSEAHDERIEELLLLNQTTDKGALIRLKPLPSSGMLYSSEIAADTNHFTNKEIRLGYNLKFYVVSDQ